MRIGVFTEKKELVGWKIDTCWSISKEFHIDYSLKDGKIPPHMISNLEHMLLKGLFGSGVRPKYLQNFETYLIGIQSSDENSQPIYTHRLFQTGVEEITDESS